jgi:hypothetical protein
MRFIQFFKKKTKNLKKTFQKQLKINLKYFLGYSFPLDILFFYFQLILLNHLTFLSLINGYRLDWLLYFLILSQLV